MSSGFFRVAFLFFFLRAINYIHLWWSHACDGPSSVFRHTRGCIRDVQTKHNIYVEMFWLRGSPYLFIYCRPGARGGETLLAHQASPSMPPASPERDNSMKLRLCARQQTMLKSQADKTPPHRLLICEFISIVTLLYFQMNTQRRKENQKNAWVKNQFGKWGSILFTLLIQ